MDNPDHHEAGSSRSGNPLENLDIDLEALRTYFQQKLGFSKSESVPAGPPKLENVSVESIAKYIQSGECKNIVTMAGAGISTSAGIPDFRSPGSGLYDNLEKYKLPHSMAIFQLDYFKKRPEAFFTLAKELYPGSFKPTVSHYFLKLLHQKKLLRRHFTQNIDNLERIAGLPEEVLVEAHGSFHTSHCLTCKKAYALEWMKERIFSDVIPSCESCNGIVKPDIVFFGENLPSRYFRKTEEDFPKADLLLIMGTSLAVQPFSSLVDNVRKDCPRLLINKEKVGTEGRNPIMDYLGMGEGLAFDSDKNVRDVFLEGDCDSGCQRLADLLGWGEELKSMVQREHSRLALEEANKEEILKKRETAEVKQEPLKTEGIPEIKDELAKEKETPKVTDEPAKERGTSEVKDERPKKSKNLAEDKKPDSEDPRPEYEGKKSAKL